MTDKNAKISQGKQGKTAEPSEFGLGKLKVFVALEETGSVAGAAKRIGGSSSGVSQSITALEQAVGAALFDRKSRPVTLTPAGQVLRPHAHRILESVAEARISMAELNMATLPQLNLAIIDDLDATLTPVLVSNLQNRFSNCFVSTFSGRSDTIIEKLRSRQADIAVTALLPADMNAYRVLPVLQEPYLLVTAKGILNPDQETREQLTNLPFVQYSEAMPLGRAIAQHLKRVRFETSRQFAFEASRSVLAMVAQIKGWTITTPLSILDGERLLPELDIMPLPFAGFLRRIYLSARTEELGQLPDQLAIECRQIIADLIVPRFAPFAPSPDDTIKVIEDEM